ncbi:MULTISPECIES: peptidase C39 family protein [unclassified Actinoplanes]|uniref:peptidase C39 family protein n=1 Tax=unclassified Actinoplanes TaxID=2626549 RepID=UPI0002D69C8D|nr:MULTISPECIES: peptidase C39 family protein [unclassified Actinoplanes]
MKILTAMLGAALALSPAAPAHDEKIAYTRWTALPAWPRPAGRTTYAGRAWESASWTGPVHRIGFGASQLVASWDARTPAGTWLQVDMRGTYTNGQKTPWYVMGRWASGEEAIRRTSVRGQHDPYSSIDTDTFTITDPARGVLLADYQLRLTAFTAPGSAVLPEVREVGAMVSDVPPRFEVRRSDGHLAWGRELAVPRRSQKIHAGQYPQYNGGGEAWCSPTSTAMVVEYWHRGPSRADLAWVDPSYADPQVDNAARHTYDVAYDGTGNWPFNTAYAAGFDLEAIVTRLHSLDDAEHFIAAGIPVITSQSFLPAELDGAGYGTAGHLMVIIGFTTTGDVIVNDPASASDERVRHVYRREQFERIWQRTRRHRADGTVTNGSGGIAYLIKPWTTPWPRVPGATNW